MDLLYKVGIRAACGRYDGAPIMRTFAVVYIRLCIVVYSVMEVQMVLNVDDAGW